VLVGAVGFADRIGFAGVLAQRVLRVEGVGVDLEHDRVAVEADSQHMVDRAVPVVAVDEEPEHAALFEVAVAEGQRQVLAVEGQVHHRRVLAPARAARPHRSVADGRVLVRDRREEFLRVEVRAEVFADREGVAGRAADESPGGGAGRQRGQQQGETDG
jgi:hypothetical protein